MTKKISMTTRPKKADTPEADDWVNSDGPVGAPSTGKPVRLTFDLDKTLHGKLRRHCFDRDIHVSEFIRDLIRRSID